MKTEKERPVWSVVTAIVTLASVTFFFALDYLNARGRALPPEQTPVPMHGHRALTPDISPENINQLPATAAGKSNLVPDPTDVSPAAGLTPIERIRAIQQKTALHLALLEDHEKNTRYFPYNRRFEQEEHDPVVQRYAVDERTTRSEKGDVALTIWSSEKFYLPGQTARIYAKVTDESGVPISSRLSAQILFQEQLSVGTLSFAGPDEDGVYAANFPLVATDRPLQAGLYKVLIVSDQEELADALTFVLSDPQIQLTGNYRDHTDTEGNLVIEAEVQVDKSARFYFQGSLYTGSDTPIGESQFSGTLSSGTQWIPLKFHRLMILDAGEPGPYTLKHLSLARVTVPIQRAPLTDPAIFTAPYALDDF